MAICVIRFKAFGSFSILLLIHHLDNRIAITEVNAFQLDTGSFGGAKGAVKHQHRTKHLTGLLHQPGFQLAPDVLTHGFRQRLDLLLRDRPTAQGGPGQVKRGKIRMFFPQICQKDIHAVQIDIDRLRRILLRSPAAAMLLGAVYQFFSLLL